MEVVEFDEKQDLLDTFLKLERLDSDLFRSTHQLRGRKSHNRVYGGQIVGQALMAANRTVLEGFYAHSLHSYFLEHVDADQRIVYYVTRIRDGRSFATRLVKAKQDGRTVFTCSISFQKGQESSIVHQQKMPEVPDPEECEDARHFKDRLINNPTTVSEEGRRVVEAYSKVLDLPEVFRFRLVNPKKYTLGVQVDEPAKFSCWVKNNTEIGDEDFRIHHCIAAFISDVTPILTPIATHAGAGEFKLGMAASLDHSMWIHHQDFRIDNDWVLYETESTVADNGRALIHGKMWTRDGRLILSISQEILVRAERTPTEKKAKSP